MYNLYFSSYYYFYYDENFININKIVIGNSSVLCSVYGPQEVKIKDELLDRATIDVNIKPQIGNGC